MAIVGQQDGFIGGPESYIMQNARTVTFLSNPDLSTWSQTISGTGTIVVSGSKNERATLTNDTTRTYLYKNFSVVAGRWYLFAADIITAEANFDTASYGDAQFLIYDGVADGEQFYPITSADNGTRRGILFQALTTRSEAFRVGPGAVGNRESGALVIENIQVVDYGTTEPTLIDRYYEVYGGTFPLAVYTDLEPASTYTAGAIVEITPTIRRDLNDYAITLCIGDSYGLNDRYPIYVKSALDAEVLTTQIYNAHIGGEALVEIRDRLDDALTGANYPLDLQELWVIPKTLILEGGGNSVLAGVSATDVLETMDECLAIAESHNVAQIIIVNLPPFKNYSSYTAPKAAAGLAYNALLADRYQGYPVYDLYNAVNGDVNTDALSNTANGDTFDYDIGDGLHPTPAASELIGDSLASMILSYEYVSSRNPQNLFGILMGISL